MQNHPSQLFKSKEVDGENNSVPTVLLAGGTGFVGRQLGVELVRNGYRVDLLTRNVKPLSELAFPCRQISWEQLDAYAYSDTPLPLAVINLAGESIATGRWTKKKKTAIVDSRVDTTQKMVDFVKANDIPVLIQASAVGYYGSTSGLVDESSPAGDGFLAETAEAWESPLDNLSHSTRKVIMRLGVILGVSGGALAEMNQVYSMGLGASLGKGQNPLSWIDLDDVTTFVLEALKHQKYDGVFNLVAPEIATYRQLHLGLLEYYQGIKKMFIPESVVKIMFGEKAKLFLDNSEVASTRLSEVGFKFKFSKLEDSLKKNLATKNIGSFHLVKQQWVPESLTGVWTFYTEEKNLEQITPDFLEFKVEGKTTELIEKDTLIDYRLKLRGIPLSWQSKITEFNEMKSFQDVQVKGPYQSWVHTHTFSDLDGGTLVEDVVSYKLPLGILGRIFALPIVQRDVENIFKYRAESISRIFGR